MVFDLTKIEYDETYSKIEYTRCADFDMDTAMDEWELEEDEERERQLEERFRILERSLPPGQLCSERLKHEQDKERARKLNEEAEAKAQKLREEKLASLAAARANRQSQQLQQQQPLPPSTQVAVPVTPSAPIVTVRGMPMLLLDREELENQESDDSVGSIPRNSPMMQAALTTSFLDKTSPGALPFRQIALPDQRSVPTSSAIFGRTIST